MRNPRRALIRLATALFVLAACQTAASPSPAPTATVTDSPTQTLTPTLAAMATPAPSSTPTIVAPPTQTSTAAPTATPASTEAPPPTASPAPSSTATPRPSPTPIPAARLSVPAGGSAALHIDASALLAGAFPLTWRVSGLPAGINASTLNGPAPGIVAVWLQSDCTQAAGTYAGALEATVAETFVITRVSLTIAGTAEQAAPGTRVISMGNPSDQYSLRRGGPSTARSGPGLALTFCRAQAGRRLTALVSEAKTISGGALSPFPALSLLRVYGAPSPRTLQTTGIGANAVDVLTEDSGRIEWAIVPGTYALVADASPLIPPERRPHTITIVLQQR
ncbi:MAG TPA: hypothetical protein PLG23_03790 [Thermoflexales bacterium]|nr:hypothetical protein [Thermoflexales bacterium]HQZ52556.1 hypothetical protein [Thermoflexales bacterium]